MRRGELIIALLLAALASGIMIKAGEVPAWQGARFSNIGFAETGAPASGFWPFWLCAIMLGCCIWVFINAWRRKTGPSQKSEPFLDSHGIGIIVKMGGGVLAMIALTEVISMYAAMTVFLFYYVFFLGRHPFVLALALALVVPFWLYLFFDITMTKTLPKGLLVIEDAVYAPLDSYFRELGKIGFALYFLISGALLAAAAALTRQPQASDKP